MRDQVVPNVLAGHRPVSRRRFLELLGAAGATAAVPLLFTAPGARPAVGGALLPPGYVPTYPDGVMAGDPVPDGSVIWTRLARPSGGEDLPVLWEVADDATFASIVAGGATTAGAAAGHTVKVGIDTLQPDRWYHYRFTVGATASPVGRLRTAPREGSTPDRLRFAFASCQQRGTTYAAHRAIAEEPDLDFFMHLGDYVYVSDTGTQTVDQYRGVYHTFKSNSLLQLCQATVPTVAMFDDGEFYNGVDSTGPPARLAAAHQVWFEEFPVLPPAGDPFRAYRTVPWGSLADIFMLDVRSYRDPAIDPTDTRTPAGAVMLAEGRTTLGSAQKQWLKDGLLSSSSAWRFFGNPYNMGIWRVEDHDPGPPRPAGVNIGEGVYTPNEAWDDYSAERRELLEFIAVNGIPNVISCSAHTHIYLASHMAPDPDDPASPIVAFDFTTGSLTADPDLLAGLPDPVTAVSGFHSIAQLLMERNPMTYINFLNFGYTVVDVEPCATTVEFKTVNVYDAEAQPYTMARFRVHTGASSMESEFFPAPAYSAGPDVFQDVPTGATGLTPPADCVPPAEPGPTPGPTPTTTGPTGAGAPQPGGPGRAGTGASPAPPASARPVTPGFTG